MKKIYFVLSLLCLSAGTWAQLLTENFSYTAGTLITANGWTAHNAGGTNAITVTSPSLTYTGHPGSGVGNAISMTTSGEDDNRTFTAVTTGSAYASFLVNLSAAQATGDYFIGLYQTNTIFPVRVYARTSGAGFNIGISKSNGAITYDAAVLNFGTTYFIVIKYVYNAGVNDDAVSLWVDPALGGAEGAATLANITGAVADATSIVAFYVRQGAAGNAPTQRVDAILVGTTWAEVTPSAAGTPNVVVTPTSLTGFSALSGVPSAEQTYTVSGTDLTANISIVPPAGFEISTTTAPFTPANPITLTQTGGVVTNTTIYVRMNSVTAGLNTGNITHTSAGSNNPNVSLTGNVLAAEPTSQGLITIGTVTNNSIDVSFTAGDGAKQLLVIHALTPVANNPVDGTTYTANAGYGLGSNLGANTYVVYNGISGNGGAPVTVTGLTAATQYHFALYEYNDGGVAGAENYLIAPLSTGNATTLSVVNTYTWTGANGTAWTDPLNWLPVRTTPATNDSLLFIGPLTVTVTGVPAETIGYLGVSLGANVTLQAAVTTTTLNIGNSTGVDLEVAAGTQLNISGANGYTINIATGATAIIGGTMTFTNGAHKLIAADANAVTFNSGSTFTAGTGFSGNPFGTVGTGTANSVVFTNGSTYVQVAGSNPFALVQPASVVVFQTGSLFKLMAGLIPSVSGRTYANFEFDAPSATIGASGNNLLTMDNLTVTSGSFALGITGAAGFNLKGNVYIAPGASFSFSQVSVGILNLCGTAPQTITNNGTLGISNTSLTINNPAGVTSNSDLSINGVSATNLTLTSGILRFVSPATTILLSANTTLVGGSNTSFVDGKVRKVGNTNFTFPVGKTGFGYVPIGISNFVGGTVNDTITAEYIRGNARLLGPVTAIGLDHVSGCDYWTLNLDNGTPTLDVTCEWSANNVCNGTYVNNLGDLVIAHFDGTNWNSFGGTGTATGTPAAGTITWPGVTTFSPFSLGSISFNNPLPITINFFTGMKQNGNHLLNWKVTCNSSPTANMVLERSSNGRNYSAVYSLTATALQCQQPFNYTDAQPAAGINYYRLKMTDASGKVIYSSVITLINATRGIDVMNIAPNPIVGGKFSLRVSAAQNGKMDVIVTDMQGRMMQRQSTSLLAGFNQVPVNVSSLAAGSYQVSVMTSEGRASVQRFVIQ